jgi:hypothetical protein
LIYYCEKASDLITSDPSPCEVIVELLIMKPSHIKIKMRERPLVAAYEMENSRSS